MIKQVPSFKTTSYKKFLFLVFAFTLSFFGNSKDIYVNDASTVGDVWCTASGSIGGPGTVASPYSTLKTALTNAVSGDIIYVDAGNYTEKSLLAKSGVTVIGAGAYKTTFTGGSYNSLLWFMKIDGITNFSISNIMTSGYLNNDASMGQNFTVVNSSNIIINNLTLATNRGSNGDAAIFVGSNSSNITLDGISGSCHNTSNSGTAIVVAGQNISLLIKNSLFSGNNNSSQGSNGSALQVKADAITIPDVTINVENCIYSQNTAKAGGAIYIQGGSVTINKCKFLNNKTTNTSGSEGGGAIWVSKTNSLCTISNSEFKDNVASLDGGAIQVYTGVGPAVVKIENCLFENNTSNKGKDIHTRMKLGKPFNVTVNNCIFKSIGTNIVSGPAISAPCEDGVLKVNNSGMPSTLGINGSFDASCKSTINIDNLPSGYTDPGITFPTYQETCPNAVICNPAIPGAAATVTCPATTANITVTGPANSTFDWYDVASGGTALGKTSNISPASPDFSTPTISASKTFYVVSSLDNCQTRVPISVNYDCPSCTSAITYSGSIFCQKDKVSPILTPTPSGSFIYSCIAADAPNAKTDLIINSSTGEIDLANSKPGKYTIQSEVSASCKPTTEIIIKPKPATPTLGTPVDPTCALDGSVLISGLPPLSGSTTWTLKSTAKYNFSTTGNTATYNYTALKPNSKIKFIVDLDGCLSDSTAELTVANVPGKPYLEGPSSVCLNSEITLKAWTDNTKSTKSTPKVGSAWTLKEANDIDTVLLTTGTDPLITSNKIKGISVVSPTKASEATIVYTEVNGCTAEKRVTVNPSPIIPILSHLPANPLVFTGNKADSVCKGSDIEFDLTGGTIGDNVYFKDTVLTGTITAKPYLIQATNTFKKKNVLSDINILIDSVSNGKCRVNAQPVFKITMVDTAFSLKAFPTTNCGTSTGKIEVTTNSTGKLSWANSDLSVTGNQVVSGNTSTITTIPNLKEGTYTVKFINGGCEISETVSVFGLSSPYLEPSLTVNPLSICAGDSIVLNAWTDNTKAAKSIPKSNLAWTSDNANVIFRDTVNPTITSIKVVANTGGTSVITYTDINGCKADITFSIKTSSSPITINNATDLIQSFCAADINKVSDLKPARLKWFDEKGAVEIAPTTNLKSQFYYAGILDANGCFTKKSDRIKVEVKINTNPNDPAASTNQSFCKVDNPTVANLLPAPSTSIKWFLKSGSNLTAQLPTDKLGKEKYVVKSFQNGCLSVTGIEVNVDTIGVEKPIQPNQKLCANNETPLTLAGLYSSSITNYYFYDLVNVSQSLSHPVVDGEQYKVRQTSKGCSSEDLLITINISQGTPILSSKYVLTPAICKVENPTLATLETKYSVLPTSGTINWYDAQNASLSKNLSKSTALGGNSYSYWIAVKDVDGCFTKKQQVDFTIDPGKKPELNTIDLCKGLIYKLSDLEVANITNPKGILTWYTNSTGTSLSPTLVVTDATQEYWASYKETITSCEGERVKMNINYLNSIANFKITQIDTIVCPGGNINFKTDITPAVTSPIYQWTVNGTKVGVNSPIYWSNTLKNNDKINVNVTGKDFCPASANLLVRMDTLRLSMQLPSMMYLKDPAINLVGYPVGGTFSGKGIANNKLDPSVAGVGNKLITYSYKNANNCSGQLTHKVVVYDTLVNNCHVTTYDTVKVNITDTVSILKFKFKLTTGIKANQETSMRVFPNPTSDILVVEAADEKALDGYRYKLMDAAGKEVYNQPVKSTITEISLKSLGAAGTYFFEVFDEKQQRLVTKKIILD